MPDTSRQSLTKAPYVPQGGDNPRSGLVIVAAPILLFLAVFAVSLGFSIVTLIGLIGARLDH